MTQSKSGVRPRDLSFSKVYNDTENFKTLADVAVELGIAKKTVQNYAGNMRERARKDKDVPELVSRASLASNHPNPKQEKLKHMNPEEISELRANTLGSEMGKLFTETNYPVVNPEAMRVAPAYTYRLDRVTGKRVKHEGAPRTWLADTLRVEPVPDAANKKYIFTGAQNDTSIHEPFWKNLIAYAEFIGAEIVVGPWTYETSWWTESNPASRSYHSDIAPYLCFGRMDIGDHFMFAGEMNTLPTAQRPIGDLTTYSQGKWAVYPHARLQLISIPSINPTDQAFQIMTTGAVTIPQVTPRKAGIKSINHHHIGATIVEFNQHSKVFCRQITADKDGNFQDLDLEVTKGKVGFGRPARVMTAADLHLAKMDKTNAMATFGFDYLTGATKAGSILDVMQPEIVALHDIHDHESKNHHHQDDISHAFEMAERGRENVKEEVQRAVNFLKQLRKLCPSVAVVDSNHDLALERYIREGRYREDGTNLIFGLELDMAYHQFRQRVAKDLDADILPEKFSLLEHAVRALSDEVMNNVNWVYDNDSLVVDGVQVGFHGFRGANGAKGTVSGYAKMGHKITIGDKHSPAILDNVFGAGVMQLKHGYNKGPSGWCVSHVIQYQNGTRTLITMQDGNWRA